jgi:uncharacterized protein YdhG (YjbR/CyaY superfamily)
MTQAKKKAVKTAFKAQAGKAGFETIDEYIAMFPAGTQKLLKQVRKCIKAAAPGATEKISYRIPTFYLNGNLVHFAAFAKHIGFYPGAAGISKFAKEISGYKNAKGSVQFPLDAPMPLGLIERIVRYRVAENPKKKK